MKRDMDFIRDLLLKMEEGQRLFKVTSVSSADAIGVGREDAIPDEEAAKLRLHLDLLEEAGLITEIGKPGGGPWYVERMTWQGYEFVETLRDPEIWKKTKAVASKAGSAGFSALIEIGKAVAKSELQKLGLPIP